jgi:flavin reductase (DIM6/NTAB) family NADH-FMN oxidoreductase RutF
MSRQDAHRLLVRLGYPMFIVTAVAGRQRAGCLVGFATQTSIHPPRMLVHLTELFGGETGDDVDKFARTEWDEGPRGLPIVRGCPGGWWVTRSPGSTSATMSATCSTPSTDTWARRATSSTTTAPG